MEMDSRSCKSSFLYVFFFCRAKLQMLACVFLARLVRLSPLLYACLLTLSQVTLQRNRLVPTSFNFITFKNYYVRTRFSFFSLLPRPFPCPAMPSLYSMSSIPLLLNHETGYPTPSGESWSQLHTSNFIHPEQLVCIYLWRVTHAHFY